MTREIYFYVPNRHFWNEWDKYYAGTLNLKIKPDGTGKFTPTQKGKKKSPKHQTQITINFKNN